MIAVDTNILVYAHRADSPWHGGAEQCIRGLAEGASPWAIPWPCLHEFLAVVTSPRIFRPPTPLALALEQVDAWLASPSLVLLSESPGHWEALKRLLHAGHISGAMVHDARIATLCVNHGIAALWSADRDFSRFRDLKVVNPLSQ